MSQSLSRILVHLVFSTKNRAHLISETVEADLHSYLAGICRGHGAVAFRVGGTANHVHIACTLPRTLSVSELVQQAKQASSAWIKNRDERLRDFTWQAGYGAFSLGQSQLRDIADYIERQKEHHRHRSFKEELRRLLRKYGVEFDEQYLWD